jgi:general secretion pathway protein J
MTRPCAGDDAGMTLVELLVVLAVLALLGGLMAAGLHTAALSWQHIARHNADREELEALHTLLRGVLSEIYPAKFNSGSRVLVQFDGQRDHLDFLAPLPQRFGAQDIVRYSLRFAPDGSMHLAWGLDRQSAAGVDDLLPTPADEGIADCQDGSFSYYGQIDATGASRWSTSWQGQGKLPRLVRARFIWHGEAQELVVAPLVTAAFCSVASPDAACLN